ncbi:hypothetical protein WMY93_016974 [Mugilogobius chulae]|uniref:SANTA domain-containing protein n=1 Tax=Mugilogobius chulae TaxID=88201 RepID=A0AAW0NXX3_9GOBI
MASYQQIQHQFRAPFESPAKIFAKLKSKLQRPTVEDYSDDECRADEFHGAQCTPKKRTDSHNTDRTGVFSPLRGQRIGEVTAVTLSPISSPQKSLPYKTNCELLYDVDTNLPFNPACRRRPFMESTTVCNTKTTAPQTHMDGSHTRTRPADDFALCERVDLENAVPHFISPKSVFSPMKKRLRKRKSDNRHFNKSNSTSDVDYVHYTQKERKISPVFREDDHIRSTKNVEPFSQDLTPEHNGCAVETLPQSLMNPAKMFAYLKERENQRDQRVEAVWDIQSEARVGPDSATSPVDGVQCSDTGSTDEDLSHDSVSDVPLQPILLEDPIVLNSPRISIPKSQETVCRRTKWPRSHIFPTENVIHLRKWFLRGSRKGLFVDGIHREKNIPWNSNIIVERVSSSVLKTVSSRVYILVGKMDLDAPSQFPKWFLKHFVKGFPSNWKELYEKYLSQSNGKLRKSSEEQTEKTGQKLKANLNQSLKRQEQQQKICTTQSCPSSAYSMKVSRSGRLIKPPLDYWMGGRVMVDADMNVTVYEHYDTTIIEPVTTSVSPELYFSTKPHKQTAPGNNVCEQHKSSPKHQLQRKVKASQRKPRQNKGTADIKKSPSPQNTKTTTRITRSSQNGPTTEKNDEDTDSPESKITKKSGTKTKPVRTRNRSESSLRSPPSDISTSSQPVIKKNRVIKKTKDKYTDKSKKNVRSRSSQSSNSSQERETRTCKSQTKPLNNVKTHQKRKTKTPSPKSTQAATLKAPQPKRTRKKILVAVLCHPKYITGYWAKVAMMVGTRSAEECHKRHTSISTAKMSPKRERKTKKAPLKEKANPVISARVGTLRRKQQVRDFLEMMPKEDMDDVFSSAYMQSKRIEVPSICTNEDHKFSMLDQEPVTPRPAGFPEAKTPQCLHITPGMIGSSSRNYDDKFVYQLQKRMKNHYQFNVEKHAKKAKASFTPSASVKKAIRRCVNTENDTFVVWEMFPDQEEAQADSGEEEDFYFSEND